MLVCVEQVSNDGLMSPEAPTQSSCQGQISGRDTQSLVMSLFYYMLCCYLLHYIEYSILLDSIHEVCLSADKLCLYSFLCYSSDDAEVSFNLSFQLERSEKVTIKV